jgi:GH24 family phage-related lysozyme (muramidase)
MNQWKWCLTSEDGKVIKGWYFDNGKWYHLDEITGVLNTGWFQDKDSRWYYLDDKNGDMKTGWIQLKGIWYYLEPNSTGYMGSCYIDCKATIDGKEYSFDQWGHLIEDTCNGLSDKGAEFLASWEGISYKWEDVGDGYWTIGIGTATSGTLGKQLYDSGITNCTLEQAKEWARQECESCYETIKIQLDSNGVKLNQNQIDALISLSYNIGVGGLVKSTLFKNILSGVIDSNIIRENFGRYNLVNGKVWQGLVNRRKSEADLYLNGDYTGNNQ